jgi:hypothetical protein
MKVPDKELSALGLFVLLVFSRSMEGHKWGRKWWCEGEAMYDDIDDELAKLIIRSGVAIKKEVTANTIKRCGRKCFCSVGSSYYSIKPEFSAMLNKLK